MVGEALVKGGLHGGEMAVPSLQRGGGDGGQHSPTLGARTLQS